MKTAKSNNRYPLSARLCVKRRNGSEGKLAAKIKERRERGEGEHRSVIPIAGVNFDGKFMCSKGGLVESLIARAHQAEIPKSRRMKTKEKGSAHIKATNRPWERKRRTERKDIGTFGGLKGGWRGKMAGAGDWGRSMNLRGKAWGGARQGRGVTRGGCLEGMPKGGRSTSRDGGGGVLGRGQEVTRVRVCTYLSLVCILLYSRG